MAVTIGALTDWVVIARSGATVDGRKLDPDVLRVIAETYNPSDYTAVVNYNHERGNLGTVRELRCIAGGGAVELQARIRPNKYYYLYNSEEMGLFFSIEYVRKFADTGKPYLVGLAATDSPASLGTSELHFALQEGAVVELGGAVESGKITFAKPRASEGLKEIFTEVLNKFFTRKDEVEMTREDMKTTFEEVLAPFVAQMEALSAKFAAGADGTADNADGAGECTGNSEDYQALAASYAALKESFDALAAKLDSALAAAPTKSETVAAGDNEANNTGFIM